MEKRVYFLQDEGNNVDYQEVLSKFLSENSAKSVEEAKKQISSSNTSSFVIGGGNVKFVGHHQKQETEGDHEEKGAGAEEEEEEEMKVEVEEDDEEGDDEDDNDDEQESQMEEAKKQFEEEVTRLIRRESEMEDNSSTVSTALVSEVKVDEDEYPALGALEGTIIAVLFWKPGDEFHIISDGRGSVESSHTGLYYALRGTAEKLIDFQNYLMCMSGRLDHCQNLVTKIQKLIADGVSIPIIMKKIDNQIKEDEEVSGATVRLFGFHRSGIYWEVAGIKKLKLVGKQFEVLFGGSGSEIAMNQFSRLVQDVTFDTPKSLLSIIYESIAVACVKDPFCGGLLWRKSLKRDEFPKSYRRFHTIELLHDRYYSLQNHFERSLILITNGVITREFSYIDCELHRLFPAVQLQFLGYEGSLMVWILRFDSEDSLRSAHSHADEAREKLFKNLKKLEKNLETTDVEFELRDDCTIMLTLPTKQVFGTILEEFEDYGHEIV